METIKEFEVISTPVGVAITFFSEKDKSIKDNNHFFYLEEGHLIVCDKDETPLFKFEYAGRSQSIQTVDDLVIAGIQKDGSIENLDDLIINIEASFKRPS